MTDPERWARVRAAYEAADEAPDPAAALDALCRAPDGTRDDALFRDAHALLRASAPDAFLAPQTLGTAARDALDHGDPAARRLGESLGPYRLDAVLGEGGMGVVYRATDTRLGRTVAVKLVRSALASPALVRRFEAERHILARLDHPDIARLYDSGAAPDGTPFLVMACAEGVPITAYAEARRLGPHARAALVERVARAVAFAQQRLVVHRDLKPSNILVADGPDGTPTVALLDFGVARLLDTDPSDVLTQTGAAPLTPAYAAPEQLRGEPATTSTDVYALGVVLYELLAGRRPVETAGRTAAEIERLVTETLPTAPSAVAPPERRRALRGDLDTVALKALAREPARRYATASEFADDLRRVLDGRPVRARPDSAGYRTRRFVRRHRVGVAATALVALALVGGLAATAWQARVASVQRDRAEREARVSVQVSGFLRDMLAAADPDADGRDVRVADLLDRAAAGLDTSFADDPAARAALRQTLGATYRGLGLYDAAEPLLRRALADRRAVDAAEPGAGDTATASVQSDLAYVLRLRGDLAGADSAGRAALDVATARFGEHHPRTATAANDLAATARDRGDLARAETLMRRALSIDRALLAPSDPDLAIDYGNLATVLADLGRPAEAVPLYRRALAIDLVSAAGTPSADVALDLGNLGATLTDTGDLVEATRVLRDALAMRTHLLGPDHPGTLYTRLRLARAVCAAGQTADALRDYDAALMGLRAALGPVHLRVAQGLAGRAECLARAGRRAAALAGFAAAEQTWAAASPAHAGRADALVGHAALAPAAEAVPMLRAAVRLRRAALGPNAARTRDAERLLAERLSADRSSGRSSGR